MAGADFVLKNANVITMEPGQPRAELVAITGDRILLVGGSKELESVTGGKTKIIDCQGKTVMPGFIDAHCHVVSFIRKLLSFDLSPALVKSIADIKTVIRREAQRTPPGQWLSGTGYNEFYLAEKRCPTRWDIDEVAPHHPVVLSHRSLHACVLNSLALSLAGINRETPEPAGAVVERDWETGEPNGVLFEMLGYIREKVMPPLSEAELGKGIALANEQFLSYGITSLHEVTVSNDLKRWQIFRRFKDNGGLKSRVYMLVGVNAQSQFREAGLVAGSGDSQLRLGGVKLMVSKSSGKLQPPQSELNQQVFDAYQAGFQIAIHGIEESTVEAAIAALEYAQRQLPQTGRRHRIEHCAECPPPLVERLVKLRVVVVTQPPFLYYSGERYLATVPASQQPWLYRIKALLDSGVVVAGSSDSPIVPNNPLVGIYAAVVRRAASGQELLPHERVSPGQALALYTTNAAYASFEEGIKGSLAPGKLADIVVLNDDPTKSAPEQIKNIKVEMTVIGGKVVWEA